MECTKMASEEPSSRIQVFVRLRPLSAEEVRLVPLAHYSLTQAAFDMQNAYEGTNSKGIL